MKIEANTAGELHMGHAGVTVDGWTYVQDEHYDSGRWYEHHWLVVTHEDDPEGVFWGIPFDVGLTESQETEWPWDTYSRNPREMPDIELVRLYPHPTVEYKRKPADV